MHRVMENGPFHQAVSSDRGSETAGLPPNEVLWVVLGASHDAVCIIECRTGEITYANQAAEELFGRAFGEQVSLKLSDLLSDAEKYVPRTEANFVESHVRHRDGHLASVEWCLIGSPEARTAVAMLRPVTAIRSVSEIDRDPLTGLPNRRVFESLLADSVDRGTPNFAVLFVDLNGFKEVNDRFGHTVGDRVLRAVAERLPRCVRPIDTVARYGGDEFVVLLREIDREEWATAAAGRLLRAIAEPVAIEGTSVQVSASVGIVLSGFEWTEVAEIVQAADRAMYRAKALGPGRYVVFDK
jgi:diguanylate cyclase (GGDEF)-like protein